MRVVPDEKPSLEEGLFNFLLSVRDGRPAARRPLLASDDTLRELYASPDPQLCEALRHCVEALLIQLSPEPIVEGELKAPADALGLALALNNCFVPGTPAASAEDFTSRLIAALPPARERDAALAYHAILRVTGDFLSSAEPRRARSLQALIHLSPLTALYNLDRHTPPALSPIARDLLRPRRVDEIFKQFGKTSPWAGASDWLETVKFLLEHRRLARWLRHRWLAMPETLRSCRNIGLLLELLRRQPEPYLLDFVLEFYEAYDYFRAKVVMDGLGRKARAWPLLADIRKMLLTPGDSDAALELNRRGNEYFLKFRPLLWIVRKEKGKQLDYARLSTEFIFALRSLTPYVVEATTASIPFGDPVFETQSK